MAKKPVTKLGALHHIGYGCVMLGGLFAYAMLVEIMIPMLYIIWSGIGTGLITLSVQLQWGLVYSYPCYHCFGILDRIPLRLDYHSRKAC